MNGPYRVRVLSSYIYDDEGLTFSHMGRRNRWVNGFVTTLVKRGSGLREFDLRFQRAPAGAQALADLAQQWQTDDVHLVICPGTDSALRYVQSGATIPMLYFGAHPENNGLQELDLPHVAGVRLNLPLVWSFKDSFSLLTELVPGLQRIYFTINLASEFAFPNARALYRDFRQKSDSFWIDDASSHIGYRSWAFLADRAGLRYHEGPFASADELRAGLAAADLQDAAIVGLNDTVLNEDATEALLRFCEERSVPLFWVNNPAIVERVGIADFSSDFEAVGRVIGNLALDVLRDGRPIGGIPLQDDPGVRRTLNVRRARQLGVEIPAATRTKFSEIIE